MEVCDNDIVGIKSTTQILFCPTQRLHCIFAFHLSLHLFGRPVQARHSSVHLQCRSIDVGQRSVMMCWQCTQLCLHLAACGRYYCNEIQLFEHKIAYNSACIEDVQDCFTKQKVFDVRQFHGIIQLCLRPIPVAMVTNVCGREISPRFVPNWVFWGGPI